MVSKRLIGLLGALVLIGAAFAPHAAHVSAQDRIAIATGGTGGVYFPYGGALASLISEHVEGVQAEATGTSASVDNMLLIEDGGADLAFVLADTAYDAQQGNDPFENPIPGQTLATLYNNYTHIVVKGDSGINTVADLRGKRVSTGSPGSGTEVIANRILTAAGLNPDADISREQLGAAESAGAMRDGNVDAFFWSGGLPTAAVTDLGATPNITIKLLPHGDLTSALQQQYGPFYSTATIPANTYPNQAEDVEVVVVPNVLVVNESFDEELAYNIVSAMFQYRDELVAAHPAANDLTLANAVNNSPLPYHPGALRYYQEQGATPVPPATPAA
jgi:TRAP transporter TAXI family solute receptor